MKCRELSEICRRLGSLSRSLGGRTQDFDDLSGLLLLHPEKSAGQFAKAIAQATPQESPFDNPLMPLLKTIENVTQCLDGIAKPAALKDLFELGKALEKHKHTNIENLRSSLLTSSTPKRRPRSEPPREEIVRKYLLLLEESLGDDLGFTTIFKTLETDDQVKKAEAIALAKRFAFVTVKSRAAALTKIMSRHQALMISRAKSAATAGRIAG